MRIFNVNWPENNFLTGGPGDSASVSMSLEIEPTDNIRFRLNSATVELADSGQQMTFVLHTNSDSNRINIESGGAPGPYTGWITGNVGGVLSLSVHYGDSFDNLSGDGRFEAVIEYQMNDNFDTWAPLSDLPGNNEYVLGGAAFLALEGVENPNCFWTHNLIVIEDCEPPVPPTAWHGSMDNFFSIAVSPNTIGNYGTPYSGFSAAPSFVSDNNGAVAYNHTIFAKTQTGFSADYGTVEANFDPEYSNLRIIKINPATGNTLETTPIAGTFPGTYKDQSTGFHENSFWADFSGTLPTFESGFWYGFIADLTCTPNGGAPPGTDPFTVEVSGPYSYDVRVLEIPGAAQAECTFNGPVLDQDTSEYGGYSWAYNKYDQPCGGTEDVDGIYDGSPVVIPTTFTCT